MLLLLCGSLAFVAGGFLILGQKTDFGYLPTEIAGWSGIIFFGLCAIVFLITLIPGASYLRLQKEGLEVCSLFRRNTTKWQEVECFGIYTGSRRAFRNKVMINLTLEKESNPRMAAMRARARRLSGFDGMLPDTYGMKAENLVALLTEWKTKYTL
jgi:hypothetical protein